MMFIPSAPSASSAVDGLAGAGCPPRSTYRAAAVAWPCAVSTGGSHTSSVPTRSA